MSRTLAIICSRVALLDTFLPETTKCCNTTSHLPCFVSPCTSFQGMRSLVAVTPEGADGSQKEVRELCMVCVRGLGVVHVW